MDCCRISKVCNKSKARNNEVICIYKWNNMFSFSKGSQTMPTNMPPPRKLPQRSWAASIPTILTHSALNILLLPSPTPGLVPGLAGSYLCSPLERFLGSVIMRRHLQRIIQQETVWVPGELTHKWWLSKARSELKWCSLVSFNQLVRIMLLPSPSIKNGFHYFLFHSYVNIFLHFIICHAVVNMDLELGPHSTIGQCAQDLALQRIACE